MTNSRGEDGIALLAAMMAMLVVGALGVALLLGSTSETMMAANFQRTIEARYAAEAALERGVPDACAAADWTSVLAGLTPSSFVDGPPAGTRTLTDGSRIDLAGIVNVANCGRTPECGEAELAIVSAERPWGRNNPRWQLYGYGPLLRLIPESANASPFYVVLLVGDDPAENDDDPMVDGGAPVTHEGVNDGADVLLFRAEAFGPRGAHAQIDATLGRNVGFVSWRLVR